MKNLFLIVICCLVTLIAPKSFGQVGIGTETPNPKAVLELKSPGNNQGFLVPRLTTAQRTAISGLTAAENGLMVYDATEQKFYYYQHPQWQPLRTGADVSVVAGTGISITGNTISAIPDGDGNATNEIQDLVVTGATIKISNNPTATSIDLSTVAGVDNQNLTYDETSGQLTISEGNSVVVKPADNGVTSAKILDGTVSTIDLADGSVTNAKLGDNAITSGKIADLSIVDADISNTANINVTKLAQGAVNEVLTTTASGPAWKPVVGASGGTVTNVATGTGLTGGPITATGTISIANSGVGTAQLADNAVTSVKIVDGTIVDADISGVSNTKVSGLGSLATLSSVGSAQITDGSIAAADLNAMSAANGQVLKFNGAAWAPAADAGVSTTLNSGNILVGNATNVATAVTMSGDATISNSGALTIANNAITSAKIFDGTIVDADISGVSNTKVSGLGALATLSSVASAQITDGSVAAADLNAMSAANGQVLKFNGTAWAPAADAGVSTTLNSGNILVGNATNVATAVTMSGDATISNSGALTIANNAITSAKIFDGTIVDADISGVSNAKVSGLGALATLSSVASAQITDGSIVAADLNAMSATNGQVLKFNGTAWAPAADAGVSTTLNSGNILVGSATNVATAVTMSGDATISNSGALTISNNAITSAEITDASIVAADLNTMSATNGQVLKFNGTTWAPAADAGVSTTLNSGNILVGSATNVATAVSMSGDATISNIGALTIANNAITSAEITDASIVAADLNAMSATNGQVLKFNGTVWAPAADAGVSTTLNSGNILVGNATNVATAATMSGDATISNTGALTIANNAITSAKIFDGTIVDADISGVSNTKVSGLGALATLSSVGSAQITDGSIVAADLNAMSATNGQVLKYNGTSWVPGADNTGSAVTPGLDEVLAAGSDANGGSAVGLENVSVTKAVFVNWGKDEDSGNLNVNGSQFVGVTVVSGIYDVRPEDYLIITELAKGADVRLPKAVDNKGRILIIRAQGTNRDGEETFITASDGVDGLPQSEALYYNTDEGFMPYSITVVSTGETWITINRAVAPQIIK
jgi:hypothetical protein